MDNERIKTLERRVAALEAHIGLAPTFAPLDEPVSTAGTAPAVGVVQLGDGRTVPAPSAVAVDYMRAGKVINAIKQYRLETGLGLAEAKHVIDNFRGY